MRYSCGFSVLPDHSELLPDKAFGERLVVVVDVASDDLSGDGLDGDGDRDLFRVDDESRRVFEMLRSQKQSVITKEVSAKCWVSVWRKIVGRSRSLLCVASGR